MQHVTTLREGLMIVALERDWQQLRELATIAYERGTAAEKEVACLALLLDDSAEGCHLRHALARSLGWEPDRSFGLTMSIFDAA